MSKLDKDYISKVVQSIRGVVGGESGKDFVPLHAPWIGGNEWEYVKDCLDSGYVSSVGNYVNRIEHDLAEFTGACRVVATCSGTSALHTCLMVAGVKNGDEVLVPALTFVATGNAIAYCGAEPHFVDCDEDCLGIDPFKLDAYLKQIAVIRNNECYNMHTGRRMSAIIPVHIYGHPCRIKEICEIAARYNLTVVEDAAESLGSYVDGIHTGLFGRLAALSFNGNKSITTGGGGAVLASNEKDAEYARHLTTTAKTSHSFDYFHDQIGFNYRMPNINAALGCAQIEQISEILARKRKLFTCYKKALSSFDKVKIMSETGANTSNFWMQILILDKSFAHNRNDLLCALNEDLCGSRACWSLLSTFPMYSNCQRMELVTSEAMTARSINLPSGVEIVKSI